MKIALIDPEGSMIGLNTGLAYLAGALLKKNHEVKVIDFNNNAKNKKQRLEQVKNFNIIGVSVKTFIIPKSVNLAKKVREVNKKALILCGGVHITIDGFNFMKENPVFDVAIMGEGEEAIAEIAAGKSLEEIDGIIYNKNGQTIANKPRERIQDLDLIPFPDYWVFDSLKEKGFPMNQYPLVTSRGCPFNCIYCAVPKVMGRKWIARSKENIIKELEEAKKKYGIREFAIYDDNFTVDIKRAKELCKMLIQKGLNFRWSCPNGIKATKIDEELASLMKKSGCYSVMIGVESGVPEVFSRIKKGGTLEDIEKAIKIFRKYGISVGGFFLIGLPGSNAELDKKSIKYSKNINLDLVLWNMVIPILGTRLYEIVQNDENTRMLIDWKDGKGLGSGAACSFDTKAYPAGERIKLYHLANLRNKSYGPFINQNSSNFEKARDILRIVIKYDPLYIPYHFFWAAVSFIKAVKHGSARLI